MARITTAAQRRRKEIATAWMLLAPALIVMLIFTVYPVFRSVYLSMTKYRMGMEAPEWIWFSNFERLAGNKTFWKVMRNTAGFAIMTVIPSMVLGLGLAMLVNRKGRHIGFIRTAYFYPSVMPMIAIASIWMFIYMAGNGLFDQLLIRMGGQAWNVLSDKDKVLPAMAVMYVWREAGYLMVFFLSGLQSINGDVLEAASIDGATGWKTFRYITLPLLKPTMFLVMVLGFLDLFKSYGLVISMTNGGPASATKFVVQFVYEKAFQNLNMGYASALSMLMLLVMAVVTVIQFTISRGGQIND